MAIDYLNSLAHVPSGSTGTSSEWAELFTVPTGKVAIVKAIHHTNITGSQIDVNVQISGSSGEFYLAKSVALPAQSSFQAADTSINLIAGQTLKVINTNIPSGSDVIVSYLLTSASVS